ncbi:NupC/NupG family nucleoside CNT transporter [Sabulicella rubraurantiaca]|uniref:NupC/NupG family nucleoside CNT transporter n=1 Tax=Sabulicella rubraurantiaca TaxID=2811429 RepID=UPI001A977B40|nr:nucleoside transporter C-terminal domain-containing protein [Sabulicella rubraurantiaca]
MSLLQLQSALGLVAFCLLSWACGGFRRPVAPRLVLAGLGATLGLAALMLHVPPLRAALGWLGDVVEALARATRAGTSLVFGFLGGGPLPYAETLPGGSFILFFQALPLVLLVGALSAVLYHWRILPFIVGLMSRALRRLFGLGGAAGFSTAANVFVGMVEAPLLIKPWLARLSRSEMLLVMVAGLATISGNMLVVYAAMIAPVVPGAAGQLLTASVISAPASVLVALLLRPGEAATEGGAAPRLYDGTLDALVRGTTDGLQLLLGIMALLIAFVALVALLNEALAPLLGVTLESIAGALFRPVAWLMGVPWTEATEVGRLLGIKLVVNEFVSYLELARTGDALSERSRLILAYALCGFTNFGSLGIMLGGLTAMCPERRSEIAALGPLALLGGTIACAISGAAVGLLTPP